MQDAGATRPIGSRARSRPARSCGRPTAVPWQALVARLDATRQVDGGQWTALIDAVIPHEEALPWVGPLVRGVAAARASWSRQDTALQARARAELVRLDRLARTAGALSDAELARLLVQGAIAGAQYERDEMQLLLEAAHDLEMRLVAGDELQVPVVLATELEADLLRLTDRYAAASERYRDLLVEWPLPRAEPRGPCRRLSPARIRARGRRGAGRGPRPLGFGRRGGEGPDQVGAYGLRPTGCRLRSARACTTRCCLRSISSRRRFRSTPHR